MGIVQDAKNLALKEIEKHFRHPQDIEWAKSKNKIYILQTRPITA